jgi:hypothetical protein
MKFKIINYLLSIVIDNLYNEIINTKYYNPNLYNITNVTILFVIE